MKPTEMLLDTYENYTRLIKEIEEQNAALKRMIDASNDSFERLAYYDALMKNEKAINSIAEERLKFTIEAFAE